MPYGMIQSSTKSVVTYGAEIRRRGMERVKWEHRSIITTAFLKPVDVRDSGLRMSIVLNSRGPDGEKIRSGLMPCTYCCAAPRKTGNPVLSGRTGFHIPSVVMSL